MATIHYYTDNIRERFADLLKEFQEGGGRILRSTLRGNRGIFAVEREGRKFIGVVQFSKRDGGIMEKVYTESDGPLFWDVPTTYLDLTECEGKTDIAKEWRGDVRAYQFHKKRLREFTIPRGTEVSIWGYDLVYDSDRYFINRATDRLVKVTPKQMTAIKTEILRQQGE